MLLHATRKNTGFYVHNSSSLFDVEQAKMSRDPGFTDLTISCLSNIKIEKLVKHNLRKPVSVRRTEVTSEPVTSLYHSKLKIQTNTVFPHPLRKDLKDRNAFCRWCSSTDHLTKHCSTPLWCNVCGSDEHLSTLQNQSLGNLMNWQLLEIQMLNK